MAFYGSYLESDVEFLLKIRDFQEISILEKERLIQTGEKHYSEVLTEEMDFPDEYLNLFDEIFDKNIDKLSRDVYSLSKFISNIEKPVIVSLARAGTPYGVLIKRTLLNQFDLDVKHYSISIIRDKGIDFNALDYIIEHHGIESTLIFVDGWTGKGAISDQLVKSISKYPKTIKYKFIVLTDIAGVADIAARREDYIIPSCLLNATISGLISRTLINNNPNDYHQAKFYVNFKEKDISLNYVNKISEYISKNSIQFNLNDVVFFKNSHKEKYAKFIHYMIGRYNISNSNYFKPGLGETTRMLIRRNPDFIIINENYMSSLDHILLLCKIKDVKIFVQNDMPIPCAGVINKFQS